MTRANWRCARTSPHLGEEIARYGGEQTQLGAQGDAALYCDSLIAHLASARAAGRRVALQ